jgi:hypothetical protein
MQITSNTTPFRAEIFVHVDKTARKHCVLVVKATFNVGAACECGPADDQIAFTFADDHYGEPGATAIRYECDFVPIKPKCDVLLDAEAWTRGGRRMTSVDVTFRGPGINKRAIVVGNRRWDSGGFGIGASDPAPFERMPLAWDRAFGGSDTSNAETRKNGSELRNLVGRGFHLNADRRTIIGRRLPNIEEPQRPMRAWSDKPDPIGFGPVGRNWQPRLSFAGTYDQKWMDERLPFLPDDFDDRYFQAAPLDQQVTRLDAGAAFSCVNMTPDDRPFVVRLPAFEIPARFWFADRLQHFIVSADTVILQPAERRVILLGRTSVPLPRKAQALREIQVGAAKRTPAPWKPHYARLGDAVAALKRGR